MFAAFTITNSERLPRPLPSRPIELSSSTIELGVKVSVARADHMTLRSFNFLHVFLRAESKNIPMMEYKVGKTPDVVGHLDRDFLGPLGGQNRLHWLRVDDVNRLDDLSGLLEVSWVEVLPHLIDPLEVYQGISGLELPDKGQHLFDSFSLRARTSGFQNVSHHKACFLLTKPRLGGHFAWKCEDSSACLVAFAVATGSSEPGFHELFSRALNFPCATEAGSILAEGACIFEIVCVPCKQGLELGIARLAAAGLVPRGSTFAFLPTVRVYLDLGRFLILLSLLLVLS